MALFFKNQFLKLLNFSNLKEVRTYARWSHRRPRRVLAPEEFEEMNAKLEESSTLTAVKERSMQPLKSNWIPKDLKSSLGNIEQCNKDESLLQKQKKKKKTKIQTPTVKETVDMLETIIDTDGNLVYTKLKNNDSIISQLLLTVKSRRHQIKQDLALLEGKRLIKDALEAKCTLKSLIFSRKSDIDALKPFLPKTGARILKMPYKEIQMWSDLSTTPGIMGIFKTPQVEDYVSQDFLPITIICDNIREPGNLGAILRTAAGVGIKSVMLTKGCVDLWDTKVLRSACGAHFHMQILNKMNWIDIEHHIKTLKSVVFIADNKIIAESNSTDNLDITQERSIKELVLSMPVLPYYSVQFGDYKSLALIIGGETEGVSEESFRIATDVGGVRLNIPMNSCVESLNVGTALGVILFEMKRQMTFSLNANVENSFA